MKTRTLAARLADMGFNADAIGAARVNGVPISEVRDTPAKRQQAPAFDYAQFKTTDHDGEPVTLNLMIQTWSLNIRTSLRKRMGRIMTQKEHVRAHVSGFPGLQYRFPKPRRITFTRTSRNLMDDDNLAGAIKHIRDELCRYLGHDDGPETGIEFQYRQSKGEPGVRVEIEFLQGSGGVR